ncbi:TBC1 domain family member 2A [Thalassophryne amazonica]|uniref:TBC1 domain family member 2A n=1 Tax=Thalassophryne amazonica TaxID=390379 RepID=UPI0014714A06|nr:TBC1 domain family member 2A [Thalassophryne amazonica]
MDERSPGGNPSAAPSHSLPAHTKQEMHDRTDGISAPATSERNEQHKNQNAILSLPSQRTDVSPVDADRAAEEPNRTAAINYGSYQDLQLSEQQELEDHLWTEQQKPKDHLWTEQQKPKDHLWTKQQKPKDHPRTKQHKPIVPPLTKHQKPEDSSRTKQQKPEDPPRTEQQKPEDPPLTKQQKPGDPPLTKQQKPGDPPLTKQQKPNDPLLTKQQKPDEPPQTKHQKPEDPLLTKHQKPEDPLLTKQQKPEDLQQTEQQKPDDHLLTEQQKPEDLQQTEQQKPDDHLLTKQQKPEDLQQTEQQKPDDHLLTKQQKPDDHLLTKQQKPDDHLLTKQQKPDDHLLTKQKKQDNRQQTEQQKPEDPQRIEQQKTEDPLLTKQKKQDNRQQTEQQKPEDPQQTEQQKTEDPLLTKQKKQDNPQQTEQQKSEDPLLTKPQKQEDPQQTEQQNPEDPQQTEQQNPEDPQQTEQQNPKDPQQTEQQNPEDPQQTEQQKPENSQLTKQQKPEDPPRREEQKLQLPLIGVLHPEDSLRADQQQESDLPQKNEHGKQPHPTNLNSPKVPPLKDQHQSQSSPQTDEQNPQFPTKDQLKLQHLSPTDQWEQEHAPLKLDQLKQDNTCQVDDLQKHQFCKDPFLSKWETQNYLFHPATEDLNVSALILSEQQDPDLHISETEQPNMFDLQDQEAEDPFVDLKAQQTFLLEKQDQKIPAPVKPLNCKEPPKEQNSPLLEQHNLQNCPLNDQRVSPADKQKLKNSPTVHLMPQQTSPAKQENNQNLPKMQNSLTALEQQNIHNFLPKDQETALIQEEQNVQCPAHRVQKTPSQGAPPPTDLNIQQTALVGHVNDLLSPSDSRPDNPSMLAPPLTTETSCELVQSCPNPGLASTAEPKLCGFLQKQGGPLKSWKQRWFTYEEKKNQLFYYRTSQDVTPLGRVDLCSATFTYPLKAERGTFHIKTPERTFILKAVTQDVMLYWLQQLQLKRWQHRQTTCSDPSIGTAADEFLPQLTSPLGLVGEDAANGPSQCTLLANVSIKHPLIEIQNSVHSLRKRSSQEWNQSVFHVDAPPWTPPNAADTVPTATTPALETPPEKQIPPSPLPLADSAESPSPGESQRSRKSKNRSSTSMPTLLRETLSSERTSRLQQEKQMLLEEIKAQKELVWLLHKALEASQLEKRTCAEFLAATCEQDRLEVLRHRERQAADLRGRLEEAKVESQTLKRSLGQRDAQVVELQENIRLLKEKNQAKQEVIIKMAEQVSSCMTDPRLSFWSSGRVDTQTFRQLQQENENLKDDIEAYKTQNKFLNSEIYQLTKLWRNSSEQEKSLMMKCAYLEASNCRLESRYLGVLRKLQENKSLDPLQQRSVQKLIEDALRGQMKDVTKLNPVRDHDQYGFKIIPDYEMEDMKLLAKIQALEIRSYNLLHQDAGERPLLSHWVQFLARRSDDDLCPSLELKGLLRGGIPHEYRQRVWRWVVQTRTKSIRMRHPHRYQQLCDKSRTCPHPASRQIQLDLHRTLTTNQHFSSPSSPALQQLQRILLAFSWQNPTIGYCQGLNRLAAIALLILQNEEDAFWCLVTVVETIMPQDYYTKNLAASQADQRVLKEFMVEKLPKIAAHFEEYKIDVSLVTFNWFLVVFVESLPSDILLPLWDAFLYEGTKVIFRYTLALFKYKEEDILKIHDGVEIYQYLRFFTKTISDSRRLTTIAFSDMNPFPGRLLKNRRAVHLERLQGELRDLEEQQREFATEHVERKDKELDTVVSEDEEEL